MSVCQLYYLTPLLFLCLTHRAGLPHLGPRATVLQGEMRHGSREKNVQFYNTILHILS
jgi:hypothetical protein